MFAETNTEASVANHTVAGIVYHASSQISISKRRNIMLLQVKESKNGRLISARELHEFMKLNREFSTWIQRRVDKYQFKSDNDYFVKWVDNTGKFIENEDEMNTMINKGYFKEYFLSFGMAKELCIIENKPLSRKARNYLITCENNYMNHLNAKLYLLDEGKIDTEKLNQWQEFLELAVEFQPNLQMFINQLLEMIDHSSFLSCDVKNAIDGLDGINDI